MFTDFIEILQLNPVIFVGVIFLLGLIVGSFLNVVIHRLPLMMQLEWLANCREFIEESYGSIPDSLRKNPDSLPQPPYNLAKPESHCPKCQRPVRWHENIPLISYLMLAGKCRGCKTRISVRYPVVELVTGLMSAATAWMLGVGLESLAALLLTWILISLTLIDFDHKLLPDQLTLPLLWLGLLINTQQIFVPLQDAVLGAVIGYLSLWSIYWLFKLLTGKEGMGYGDFKLLAALGAWMGWQSLLLIIILSSLVGAVVGIALITIRGRDRNIPIPFGPFLAAAGWIALLWGDRLLASYLSLY